MIIVSEDGKSLVKIQSWDDVIERPGYTPKVNPESIKLKKIIGRYHIPIQHPCGISSCGTSHNKGYLVVCEGGIETNIGHRCGKRIFGVEFQTLEKTFTKDTNAQRYRQRIGEVKNQLPNFKGSIEYLRSGENQAYWCIEKVRQYATTGFEENTLKALRDRARRGEAVVSKSVALTAAERQAAGGKTNFRDDRIGIISGLSAFISYKKLKTIVDVQLGSELEAFEELDEDRLNFSELRRWNNWANMVEKRMRSARDIIQDCQRFVTPSNIEFIRTNKRHL